MKDTNNHNKISIIKRISFFLINTLIVMFLITPQFSFAADFSGTTFNVSYITNHSVIIQISNVPQGVDTLYNKLFDKNGNQLLGCGYMVRFGEPWQDSIFDGLAGVKISPNTEYQERYYENNDCTKQIKAVTFKTNNIIEKTPTISVASTTSNSVTFTTTNLFVGGSYAINIFNNLGHLEDTIDINSPTSSTVTVTSTNPLSGEYTAKLYDHIGSKDVATSSPFTISAPSTTTPTISTTSTTSNSATFSLTGLTVGASYRINIFDSANVQKSYVDINSATGSTVSANSVASQPLASGVYTAKLSDMHTYVATSSPFTIAPASTQAQITSFTPTSGKVGDTITITGSNLVGVNNIYFGTTKGVTTTNSSTVITAKVPSGATSGKIKIDTASNGSVSSASDFSVTSSSTSTGTCDNGATDFPTCTPSNTGSLATPITDSNTVFKGLVPTCNTKVDTKTGNFSDPCDFNMVMAIVNKVINFLLVVLATPLFAVILIYVGWLYLSSGGSSEKVTKAKNIFKNVIIGYIIALAAFLIVKTILHTLGFTGDSFLS